MQSEEDEEWLRPPPRRHRRKPPALAALHPVLHLALAFAGAAGASALAVTCKPLRWMVAKSPFWLAWGQVHRPRLRPVVGPSKVAARIAANHKYYLSRVRQAARLCTRNDAVVDRWLDGEAGRNQSSNFRTDGQDLFVYEVRVGRTVNGVKYAVDATANTGNFVSRFVSARVGVVMAATNGRSLPPVVQLKRYFAPPRAVMSLRMHYNPFHHPAFFNRRGELDVAFY